MKEDDNEDGSPLNQVKDMMLPNAEDLCWVSIYF